MSVKLLLKLEVFTEIICWDYIVVVYFSTIFMTFIQFYTSLFSLWNILIMCYDCFSIEIFFTHQTFD